MEATQTRFDIECSKLAEERKKIKLQCLQDPSQINAYKLKNFRPQTSRYLRSKKRE
jgi:hypothetical protein